MRQCSCSPAGTREAEGTRHYVDDRTLGLGHVRSRFGCSLFDEIIRRTLTKSGHMDWTRLVMVELLWELSRHRLDIGL
jgi:hypothetical protein